MVLRRVTNAFIDEVKLFEDYYITNDNDLRGLPILLDSFRASWMQDIKSTINTIQGMKL